MEIKVTKQDLAWVAGFFDGEGSIVIQRHKKYRNHKRYIIFELVVQVNNTFPEVIYLLQRWFGGSVHKRKIQQQFPHWKPQYQWKVGSLQAHQFIKAIYPYAKVKKGQIELALKFRKTKKKRMIGIKTPSHIQIQRVNFKNRISQLNKGVILN